MQEKISPRNILMLKVSDFQFYIAARQKLSHGAFPHGSDKYHQLVLQHHREHSLRAEKTKFNLGDRLVICAHPPFEQALPVTSV